MKTFEDVKMEANKYGTNQRRFNWTSIWQTNSD